MENNGHSLKWVDKQSIYIDKKIGNMETVTIENESPHQRQNSYYPSEWRAKVQKKLHIQIGIQVVKVTQNTTVLTHNITVTPTRMKAIDPLILKTVKSTGMATWKPIC